METHLCHQVNLVTSWGAQVLTCIRPTGCVHDCANRYFTPNEVGRGKQVLSKEWVPKIGLTTTRVVQEDKPSSAR